MKKLNKKNIIKKLYEQLVGAGNTAGTQLIGNNLRQFLQNIQQPNQKYIKVLSFNRESIYPETFNVTHDLGFIPGSDSSIRIEALLRNDEADHETTVENWISDLNAIEAADNNGLNLQIKVYFTTQHNPNGVNDNNLFSCSVIYEDRTNVVFIIKDLANTGKSFNDVRSFVQNISNIAQRLNIRLDSHSIINAMPDIIENAIDTDDESVFKLMVSLLRPNTAQQFIEQFTNLTNQQNNVEPNNQQNNNQQVNEPEVIEPEIVNPDNQQNNQQNTEPENTEPENTEPEDVEPEAHQENQNEDCNGMQLIEEIQRTDIAQNWNGEDFAIAFGSESFEDFKRTLRQFPRNAIQSLTNKHVKYCQVDFGNPAGAQKRYLDVYRNFKFYIFETKNDIRWYQANRGQAAFFKLASGRTPNDMYNMLKSGTSGLDFIPFFYARIRAEIRKGSTTIQTLWASSEKFKQMTSTSTSTSTTPKTQKSNKNKSPEEKRREYIISVIKQRIIDTIVNRWKISRPITKNSDRSVNLVGGKTYIKYGIQHFRIHTIKEKDAEILAQHFDDWHWLDNNIRNTEDRRMQNILNCIMDPTGIKPPPEQEEIQLDPTEQEKLDRTIDAVNNKLEDTGIEIQITVPGHKPRYKWVMNHISEQAQGWNVNNRYFAVMFAGLDPQKLYDNEAQQFLVDMDIWRIIQNAFAEARREYPDIKLAVALDNGL